MKRFFVICALSVIGAASLLSAPSYGAHEGIDCSSCDKRVGVCEQQKNTRHCLLERTSRYFNLSDAQKFKAEEICRAFEKKCADVQKAQNEDFKSILTADQKKAFEANKTASKKERTKIELSSEQKAKLKELREARNAEKKAAADELKSQFKSILTSEQQEKLEAFKPCAVKEMRRVKDHKARRPHHGPRPDARFDRGPEFGPQFCERMVKDLELSEAQQKKINAVFEKYGERQHSRDEQMRKEMEKDRESLKKEIDSVLTAEQRAKLEAQQKEMHKADRHHKAHKNHKKMVKKCCKDCSCKDKSLCRAGKCKDCCRDKNMKKCSKKDACGKDKECMKKDCAEKNCK